MPLDAFNPSAPLTFGVELELQLVNLSDFNLTAASPDLMHLLQRKPFPGNVTPEITESMIEINSSVHTAYGPLLAELTEIRDTLVAAGDTLNIGIAGGGTHPFQHWSDQRISARPRYEYLSQLYGYLAKQFTVFGQHVHIGCANGDDAMYLLHALNRYLPHFIALSASSPYVQGHDSLFESARLNSVFAFPMSGRAPFTLSWQEFTDVYFAKMERTNIIKSMKDFYWDLRPKPEFGTIELRVCDTPLTVEKAAALACYLQAICRYLIQERPFEPAEDDYLVYTYNRFQACRFGLAGEVVNPQTKERVKLRDDIVRTLARVEAHAVDLKSWEACQLVRESLGDGNDAGWLRRQRRGGRLLSEVVEAAAERWMKD